MKKIILLSFTVLNCIAAQACVTCNQTIQDGIKDTLYNPGLSAILPVFIALIIMVGALIFVTIKQRKDGNQHVTAFMAASTILGIGLGGFIDGIVFHQVLQWHEMLSNKLPTSTLVNKSVNMFWDGIFHLFTLTATIVGIILQWRVLHNKQVRKSGLLLFAGCCSGWGIFNFIEGLINHQIFKLHNVKENAARPEVWNMGFLAFSILLIIFGLILFNRRGTAAKSCLPAKL